VDVRNLKVPSNHSQISLPRHFNRQLWSTHGRKLASAKNNPGRTGNVKRHVSAESNDSLH
jgi:hypothetical protein